MTRKEKIDFIRKYDKRYTCADFTEYDNEDLDKIFNRFSYSGSKEAQAEYDKLERQNNPFSYWWFKGLDKLSFGNVPWGITLILFFNPVMVLMYIAIALIIMFN